MATQLETPLKIREWSVPSPQGVIALIHGLGEFCERYDWPARAFNAHGFAVVSADLPGHGANVPRGHIANFEVYLDTLEEIVAAASARYPNCPVVLFGHSMGGLITVRAMQTRGLPAAVRGVVLSSPSLFTADGVAPKPALMAALRVLSVIAPKRMLKGPVSPSKVSRSEDVRHFYATNDQILKQVTVRFMAEFLGAMRKAVAAPPVTPGCPLLIAQAGKDALVSISANQKFFEQVIEERKQYQLYEACYHELLNEPERQQVVDDIATWIGAYVTQPALDKD